MATQIEMPITQQMEVRQPTPMVLIQQAIAQGNIGVEVMERLWIIQKEYEGRQAHRAYVEAMNLFKANPPEIIKNRDVAFGNTKFSHATLDHVCTEIGKGLSAVGISHAWKTVQLEGGKIRVTCVLTHAMGHSEEGSVLEGQPDTSGSKNAIQAVGSTVAYLQRYTLLSATGMAAKDQDDDGKGGGGAVVTEKPMPRMDETEYKERCAFFPKCSTVKELHDHWHNSYGEAKKIGDRNAMEEFSRLKDERKKSLLKDAVR